jgi:hypothetical protein
MHKPWDWSGPALGYDERFTFLGSHGGSLAPAPTMPYDVGQRRNSAFPHGADYFNGPNYAAQVRHD